MKKNNIKKGDTVVVITGDDKNRTAPKKVLQVLRDKNKVIVEGVNIVTKHTKPTAKNTEGGIVKVEAPIHISNIMLWDSSAKSPSRITRERSEKGKLIRKFKKSGKTI